MLNFANIPSALRQRKQWVLWKNLDRDGTVTKVPVGLGGMPAKTNSPDTWATFDEVVKAYQRGGYTGIGFVFCDADPFCGVDLDGCRDPDTGAIADWAQAIIRELGTYAEVSPSQTGVKLFAIGSLPVRTGKNIKLPHLPAIGGKTPGVEMYDHGRYFAVTGLRIDDNRAEPEERAQHIKAIYDRFWPAVESSGQSSFYAPQSVIERARAYLAKCPPAISGQGGHKTTFHTACILVKGFLLEDQQAMLLLQEWNHRCVPPWSERELEHKIKGAKLANGRTGYLRNTRPERWASVEVPNYEGQEGEPKPSLCILQAAQKYLDRLRNNNKIEYFRTGLPGVDEALGGGLEPGEMVIIAARPSHGKSAVALQCAHNFTAAGLPVLFVSEEMSHTALGKRTLLYTSAVPQEEWAQSLDSVELSLTDYGADRAKCHIIESCSTAATAVREIVRFVDEHKIRVAIIDYAQLLGSPGQSRYQEVTNTSLALRRVTTEKNIVLIALCQLNRQFEAELLFEPKNHHLKDSGQLEQDADVIIFTVRRHLLDKTEDEHDFRFYITKNRHRETLSREVRCCFSPARQMVLAASGVLA